MSDDYRFEIEKQIRSVMPNFPDMLVGVIGTAAGHGGRGAVCRFLL